MFHFVNAPKCVFLSIVDRYWITYIFALIFLTLFIYFERDRNNASGAGAEREGERENPKQIPHCQHRA